MRAWGRVPGVIVSPVVRKWLYAIGYEVTGLALAGIGVSLSFGESAGLGLLLTSIMAVQALIWNVIYNSLFEAWEARQTDRRRTIRRRILHAVCFEIGLTVLTVPVVMILLDTGFWPALGLDLMLTAFYAVYTYFYTLAFDRLFGLPESAR